MSEHPFYSLIKDDGVNIPYDNQINYHLDTKMADRVFESDRLKGIIQYSLKNNTLYATIVGTAPVLAGKTIDFLAPAPITRGYSYSGSGLPYPNPEVAYEGTASKGSIPVDRDGDFSITIEYPNSYYVRQGTVLLNPHVHFYAPDLERVYTVEVGNRIPNKSLTGLSDRYDRSTRR